jgi:hypothetical protein
VRVNDILLAGMSQAQADTPLGEDGLYIADSGETWSYDFFK